jgi:hypothetical protein
MRVLNSLCRSLILVGLLAANLLAGEFDQLLTKIPATANTLVLIDVQQTLASDLAKKEGWGQKLELAYVSRPVFLPPEASKLVIAGALQPTADFARLWELGVMQLTEPVTMRSIARSEGGYVDTIAGQQAAWTPSDAYFVEFSQNELGVLFPAERQFVSRWVEHAKQNNEVQLSEYLKKAAALTTDQIPIILAIDLHDVVQPHHARERIEDSEILKKAKLDLDQVGKILTSLQGATLRIAEDVTPLSAVAKDLVLTVLNDFGANVDDLQSWKVDVKSNAIHMEGPLSQDGLRRVFSIIEIPSTKFSSLKDTAGENAPTGEASESVMRDSSLTYYRSIDVLVKDLRRDLRGNKASVSVMERYARKIDRMPILNVDPELLDFGAAVANTLRDMALSRRQGGIDYGANTAGMGGGGYANYGVSYSYFGRELGDAYSGARTSAADRASAKASALADSNSARVDGFQAIDENLAAIRRKMSEKYQVEF